MLGLREVPIPRDVAAAIGRGAPVSPAEGAAPAVPEQQQAQLRALDESEVVECKKCKLCETRTRTVFGQGHASARLVFVGEAPGYEEDQQGLAFVGRAGQLLTKMIIAMGLKREDVFICNVLKCRPPNNRTPAADEIAACSSYLFEQLGILDPEVIVSVCFWMIVAGIVCARLFYVIQYWESDFRADRPLESLKLIANFTHGGLVIYGASLGGHLVYRHGVGVTP